MGRLKMMEGMGMELDGRILINNEDDECAAEEILDTAGIDYDWDGGGRLMVCEGDIGDIEELFDAEGIDYEVI